MSAKDADNLEGGVLDKKSQSPNIKSAADEVEEVEAPKEKAPNPKEVVEIDGIPIFEEEMEYRAKNIKQKDGSELFVKIEGAEKYAKEQEKKREEKIRQIEKEAEAERKASEKEKEKEEKESLARARSAKNKERIKKIKAIFWNKWHKYVTIIVVVLAIAFPFLWSNVITPTLENHKTTTVKKQYDDNNNDAVSIRDHAVSINEEDTEESYQKSLEYFEEKYQSASGSKKLYIAISYASYVYEYRHDVKKSIEILLPVEDLAKTDAEKLDYYSALAGYYELDDDIENYEKIKKITDDLSSSDVIIELPEEEKDKTIKDRGEK